MLPLAMVNGYDTTLSQLSVAALADLRALMASLDGVAPDRAQRVLQEAFPEIFNPYAAASSAVSASFYEEVREFAGVGGSFAAETLDTVDTSRWSALVGFGTAPRALEQGGMALAYSLLSGGLTQILSEVAADTVFGNGQNDDEPVGYQRVPKSGCCAFCGMLASRSGSDLYSSKEAATRVVGRGTPIPEPGTRRRRGGVARGIRPRGTREIGEKYHDHCACRGIPVFDDNYVEMRADAGKYFDAYADARTDVNARFDLDYTQHKSADGSLKNSYFYRDTETGERDERNRDQLILARMRKITGAA